MSHWIIDLRQTTVKKWAKYMPDITLELFSKNKKKLKQARKLKHAMVCDVSGKKYGNTILKHIKKYLSNHHDAQLLVFTRSKKLRKRCQKWQQAHYPEAQLLLVKKLPCEWSIKTEAVEIEMNVVVLETVATQTNNNAPTAAVETPSTEASETLTEAIEAETQANSDAPTAAVETPDDPPRGTS